MSVKDLKKEPHELSETEWWYETEPGIVVVAEKRDESGKLIAVTQTYIKWFAIRNALKRLDK